MINHQTKWQHSALSDVVQILTSNVDKKTESGEVLIRLCNYTNVFGSNYITADMPFMTASASQYEIDKFRLQKHDIVLTKDSETVKDIAWCSVVIDDIKDIICGYHLAILRPNPEIVYGPFLRELLSFHGTHRQFVISANGVIRFGLTQSAIQNIKVILPSILEQRKIADILFTWDKAIAKTERLIVVLHERKKGLMQLLLNGQMRFPKFGDKWVNHKLSDLLEPIARKEKIKPNKQYSLIGVKWYVAGAHIHDVVSGDQIAIDSLSRIQENDVLYNKMWVTKNAFGIARKEHDGAYGSSEYPQFTPKPNKVDVNFLGFFFHNAQFQHNAHRLCKGTTGRARLNPGDFLGIEVRIPRIEEQIKISEFLQACDVEIQLFSRKLEALKQQKKGLTQKLLTGQIRVKV